MWLHQHERRTVSTRYTMSHPANGSRPLLIPISIIAKPTGYSDGYPFTFSRTDVLTSARPCAGLRWA
jgi:hypothetical protein